MLRFTRNLKDLPKHQYRDVIRMHCGRMMPKDMMLAGVYSATRIEKGGRWIFIDPSRRGRVFWCTLAHELTHWILDITGKVLPEETEKTERLAERVEQLCRRLLCCKE